MITKARYLTPGSFFPEEDTRVLSGRDVCEICGRPRSLPAAVAWQGLYARCEDCSGNTQAADVDEALRLAPDSAFCFTIYDLEEAPDLGPDFTVRPKPKNETGRYYIGGDLFDADQIEALDDGQDHRILLANMQTNRWRTVIRCRYGSNWQPFHDGDTLLPEPVA